MSAQEALAAGMVDEVAPSALDRALSVAQELAGRSPGAVAAILRLTRDDAPLHEVGRTMGRLLGDDAAVRQRLHAFVERGERLDRLP